MYYSNGNYEAFARPKKPEGIDSKNAYIIGTGLAALSAACYLVRDAQMPGDHIHVFEKDPVPGGACDGANIPGGDVGSVPFYSVHRDGWSVRIGRILLAQQGGSELFAMPLH